MRPTSAASRPPRACRRSISRSTAPSRSRSCAALVNSPMAEWMQQLHPLRLQYELFSDANPMMAPVAAMAEQVRERAAGRRRPTIRSSRCRRTCRGRSSRRSTRWRDMSEALAERTFLAVYGSPALQAAVGIDPAATQPLRKAAKSPLHQRAAADADRRAASRAFRSAACAKPSSARSSMSAWRGARSTSAASRRSAASAATTWRPAACRSSRRWCASSSSCC